MKKKLYVIRIEPQEKLYDDYTVIARTEFGAKRKAKKSFYKRFPKASKNIKIRIDMIVPIVKLKED